MNLGILGLEGSGDEEEGEEEEGAAREAREEVKLRRGAIAGAATAAVAEAMPTGAIAATAA